jgi:hypothetical protein
MSDGFFFLSVFFFFFAAWLAGGGPNKPISFAGPYITPITNVGVRQTGYGGPLNFNTSTGISSARSNLFTIQSSVDDLGKQVSDAKLFGTPSPRKGQVTIGWGSSVGASDPKQEYVSIRVVHDAPQNIDITGWRLQSVSSDYSATIPQGTELLSGTGNNAKADIILRENHRSTLHSTKTSAWGTTHRVRTSTLPFRISVRAHRANTQNTTQATRIRTMVATRSCRA